MESSAQILESLGAYARRCRQVRLVDSAARWGRIGSVVALLAALALKAAGQPVAWALVPLGVLPFIAALHALLRPMPLAAVAREVDRRAALDERLSTALEWILGKRGQTLMSRAQLRDASQALQPLAPRDVFPLKLPRRSWTAVPMIVATVVLMLIPAWHLFGAPPVPVVMPDLTKEADALDKTAQEIEKGQHDPAVAVPDLSRTAQDLKELARQMRSGQMSEREAMARIAQAREAVSRDLEKVKREQSAVQAGGSQGGKKGNGSDPAGREQQQKQGSGAQKSGQPQKVQTEQTEAQKQQQKALREALGEKAKQLEEAARQLEMASGRVTGEQQVAQGEGGKAAPNDGGGPSTKGENGEEDGAPKNAGGDYKTSDKKGKGDYGRGTTGTYQKGVAIKPKNYVLERQSKEKKEWTVAYQKMYEAQRREMKTANGRVKGDRTEQGPSVETDDEVRGAPRSEGGSALDEQRVYTDSRRRAEEAMAKETVPDEYRDLVRNYFEEINPGDSKR